jgi:hypothetical protein
VQHLDSFHFKELFSIVFLLFLHTLFSHLQVFCFLSTPGLVFLSNFGHQMLTISIDFVFYFSTVSLKRDFTINQQREVQIKKFHWS